MRCTHCKGTGEVSEFPCFNCRGSGREASNDAKEVAARAFIRQVIHDRDGIVMGRDPLGRLCRCGCLDEPAEAQR